MPMVCFEPGSSSVRGDRSANCATTTALRLFLHSFDCDFESRYRWAKLTKII